MAMEPDSEDFELTRAPGATELFRVFRHRNYRLFFVGQLVSLMGSWISRSRKAGLSTRSPIRLCSWDSLHSAGTFLYFSFRRSAVRSRTASTDAAC